MDEFQTARLKLKGPTTFNGSDDDWENWSRKMVIYCGSIDFRYGLLLEAIARLPRTTELTKDWVTDWDLRNPNNCKSARTLAQLDSDFYGYLAEQLVDSAAAYVLRERGTLSGFLVWRRLVLRYIPLNPIKAKALLTELSTFKLSTDTFLTDLVNYEVKLVE
jgi:hypothetical protein